MGSARLRRLRNRWDLGRGFGFGGNGRLQEYIQDELDQLWLQGGQRLLCRRYACGAIAMKNIAAKVVGDNRGIIMLATHYDTKLMQILLGG